jgi:peptide/nickel transport system permease protein
MSQLTLWIPATVLTLLVIAAIFSPLLAPMDPNKTALSDRLLPPSFVDGGKDTHFLGTDKLGRDIFSRVIFGARISLSVSLLVIAITGGVGTIVGIISGYVGGMLDSILMRITDVCLSFPALLIALLLAATMGPSFWTVVLALSILGWAGYARLIRGEALRLRETDFVLQARVNGCGAWRIMIRHIFPNVVNPLIVLATMMVGTVILMEAALSFLGAGIPPPTASWGAMVNDGRSLIETAWWISTFPGIAIGLVVLSGNFLGDWLRDKLDPRLRQI